MMNNTIIDSSLISQLPRHTIALILAGGRGSRLHGLTDNRAKPAVPFGGRFRIIDFALSNCVNSGINRIGVITQYKAHSLLKHIQQGWSFLNMERNEFVDMLPARQQLDEGCWYRGTADAVYQNMEIMRRQYHPKYVLILAGDHIYKMNYLNMLIDHVNFGGECTVGCIEVNRQEASEFGVMSADSNFKITQFVEKPQNPPAMPNNPDKALASMGIYIFNADYLYGLLEKELFSPNSSYDFGKDLIPYTVAQGKAYAHTFNRSCVRKNSASEPYWRDVGTIDSYWEANMDLVSANPSLELDDNFWPIHSCVSSQCPSHFIQNSASVQNLLQNTLISGGCLIEDARITDSILFHRVQVHSGSIINSSVVLPGVSIGRNCRLNRCIIERECQIPDGLVIGENPTFDASHFYRSPNGIVLITPPMLEQYRVATEEPKKYLVNH
jgi:glucose-1-phosphate adenylyltransferase